MSSVDLTADLDMTVARDCIRPWMEKAVTELHLEVARTCPPARIWQALSDDKVRPTHKKADGQAIPTNLRFILDRPERGPTVHGQVSRGIHHEEGHHGGRRGNIARKPEQYGTEQGRYPRDEQLSAGNRINCFPAGTLANAPDLAAAWRAPYAGPMVTVHTALGRVLTGTPNHPVLTRRGWVALGSLDVGDDVVCRSLREAPADRSLPVPALVPAEAPYEQRLPAQLGEIFDALAVAGKAQRVVGDAVDFYGDRPAGDVHVVRAGGMLRGDGDAVLAQEIDDLLLAAADASELRRRLPGALRHGGGRSAAGGVGGQGEPLAFVGASAGHAGVHGRRPAAQLGTATRKPPAEHSAGYAALGGKNLRRNACLVSLDQGRQIGRWWNTGCDRVTHFSVARDWLGYVYTLSTGSGIYDVAGGLVVANCRCQAVVVPGLISATVIGDPVEVAGTIVRGTVGSRFPRIAESEFGDGEDAGLHFMAAALEEYASRLAGSAAR